MKEYTIPGKKVDELYCNVGRLGMNIRIEMIGFIAKNRLGIYEKQIDDILSKGLLKMSEAAINTFKKKKDE